MSKRFPNTEAALKAYDATEHEREELFRKVKSPASFNRWNRRDIRDVKAVQIAFWNDTSRINTYETCLRTPLSFMRQCVESDNKKIDITCDGR